MNSVGLYIDKKNKRTTLGLRWFNLSHFHSQICFFFKEIQFDVGVTSNKKVWGLLLLTIYGDDGGLRWLGQQPPERFTWLDLK